MKRYVLIALILLAGFVAYPSSAQAMPVEQITPNMLQGNVPAGCATIPHSSDDPYGNGLCNWSYPNTTDGGIGETCTAGVLIWDLGGYYELNQFAYYLEGRDHGANGGAMFQYWDPYGLEWVEIPETYTEEQQADAWHSFGAADTYVTAYIMLFRASHPGGSYWCPNEVQLSADPTSLPPTNTPPPTATTIATPSPTPVYDCPEDDLFAGEDVTAPGGGEDYITDCALSPWATVDNPPGRVTINMASDNYAIEQVIVYGYSLDAFGCTSFAVSSPNNGDMGEGGLISSGGEWIADSEAILYADDTWYIDFTCTGPDVAVREIEGYGFIPEPGPTSTATPPPGTNTPGPTATSAPPTATAPPPTPPPSAAGCGGNHVFLDYEGGIGTVDMVTIENAGCVAVVGQPDAGHSGSFVCNLPGQCGGYSNGAFFARGTNVSSYIYQFNCVVHKDTGYPLQGVCADLQVRARTHDLDVYWSDPAEDLPPNVPTGTPSPTPGDGTPTEVPASPTSAVPAQQCGLIGQPPCDVRVVNLTPQYTQMPYPTQRPYPTQVVGVPISNTLSAPGMAGATGEGTYNYLPLEYQNTGDTWTAAMVVDKYDLGCPLSVDPGTQAQETFFTEKFRDILMLINVDLCVKYEYLHTFRVVGFDLPLGPTFMVILVCVVIAIIRAR
jgi:hypothetical protein